VATPNIWEEGEGKEKEEEEERISHTFYI